MKIVGKERPGGIIGYLNKVLVLKKFIENVAEKPTGTYGDHRTAFSVGLFLALWEKKSEIDFPALTRTSRVLGLAKIWCEEG